MGEVIQFIPKPNPNRKTLDEQAAEIMSEISGQVLGDKVPCGGAGIDGIPYQAPPEDCA